MNHRKRLKIMLVVEFILILIHGIFVDNSLGINETINDWHYILPLGFGFFIVVYALNIKCNKCNARQVFRGWSIFDLRFPEEKCYRCGAPLENDND